MNMTHPTVRQIPSSPVGTEGVRPWRAAAVVSLLVTALGTLMGSTLSAAAAAAEAGWVAPILTPLIALLAAGSVYGHYRHRPLDVRQARTARVLVMTAAAMMLVAVFLGRPSMAGAALWFMTAVTVIVTALAAGAGGIDNEDDALSWVVQR